MRSGPMRYRITIFSQPTTQDSFGEESSAEPIPLFSCWASIVAATSSEIYALGPGFTSTVTHKITIRYPEQVPEPGVLITFVKRGVTRYFILQTLADPDERGRELDLMVLEKSK